VCSSDLPAVLLGVQRNDLIEPDRVVDPALWIVQRGEPYGLRMISFSVLVLIADNPGIRQSTISETLCVERPNLVVVIDELENRALITRNPVPADRRAYALKVTLAGRQLCDKAVAAADRHENEMTQGTGRDEREALIEILNKIERNLLSRQSSSGQRRRQT